MQRKSNRISEVPYDDIEKAILVFRTMRDCIINRRDFFEKMRDVSKRCEKTVFSMGELSKCYRDGIGCEADSKLAEIWMNRAYEKGNKMIYPHT